MKSGDILSKLRRSASKETVAKDKDVPPGEQAGKGADVTGKTAEKDTLPLKDSFRALISAQSGEVREMFNYVIQPEERTLKIYLDLRFCK